MSVKHAKRIGLRSSRSDKEWWAGGPYHTHCCTIIPVMPLCSEVICSIRVLEKAFAHVCSQSWKGIQKGFYPGLIGILELPTLLVATIFWQTIYSYVSTDTTQTAACWMHLCYDRLWSSQRMMFSIRDAVSRSFLMQDSCMHDELLTCDDIPQLDWMNSLLHKHDFEGLFFLSFCYYNSFFVFFINELQTMLGRNGWVLGKRWVWHEMGRENVQWVSAFFKNVEAQVENSWGGNAGWWIHVIYNGWSLPPPKKKMVNTIYFHIYKFVWTCIWLLDQLVKYM